MNGIVFENLESLLGALSATDISVPRRTAGRRKKHTERWTFYRLLATLATHEYVCFPLSFAHGDRPDFLLTCGSKQIGVEVSEAISPRMAKADAVMERDCPHGWIEVPEFGCDAQDRSDDEIRSMVCKDRLTSVGWGTLGREKEWAKCVAVRIVDKQKKLAAAGWRRGDKNWLAIYHNQGIIGEDVEKAVALMREQLASLSPAEARFDVIFVDCDSYILRLSPSGLERLTTMDLW